MSSQYNQLLVNCSVSEVYVIGLEMLTYTKKLEILKTNEHFAKMISDLSEMISQAKTRPDPRKVGKGLPKLDKKRWEAFQRIKTALVGVSVLPDAAIQQNARDLLLILNKADIKNSLTKQEKNGNYIAFIAKLDKGANNEKVKSIAGLNELFEQLKAAQEAYMSVNVDKTMSRADSSNKPPSYYKPLLLQIINKRLLPYLSVMTDAEGGEYENCFRVLNAEIKKVNSQVKQRATRAKKKKEKAAAALAAAEKSETELDSRISDFRSGINCAEHEIIEV